MDGDDFNKAAKNGAQPCASDYMDMLDSEDDLSEEQKLELLETLFGFMKSFVLMGYGMEAVHKLVEEFEYHAHAPLDMLECNDKKEIHHE